MFEQKYPHLNFLHRFTKAYMETQDGHCLDSWAKAVERAGDDLQKYEDRLAKATPEEMALLVVGQRPDFWINFGRPELVEIQYWLDEQYA